MISRLIAVGLVLSGFACNETVVTPPDGGGGSGTTTSSASTATTSTSSSGGAAPTNCWGCSHLSGNWFTGVLPPADQQCPGAFDLAKQTTDCYCGHCTEFCPFCPNTGNNTPGCNPCIEDNCKELAQQCGADKRTYEPEK